MKKSSTLALIVKTLLFIAPCIACIANAQYAGDNGVSYIRAGYELTQVWSNNINGAKAPENGGNAPIVGKETTYFPKFNSNKRGLSIAFGQSFGEVRTELEGIYLSNISTTPETNVFYINTAVSIPGAKPPTPVYNKFTNKGFNHITIMANGYYDSPINDLLIPYIGGGAGISRVQYLSDQTPNVEGFTIALQGKAGINFAISSSLVPYIGGRVLYLTDKEFPEIISTDKADIKQKIKSSYITYGVEVGLFLAFNNLS